MMSLNATHLRMTASRSNAPARFMKYDDFPATQKYVEYYIEQMYYRNLLTTQHATLSFDEKRKMRDICDVLQRKQDYAYKHANFAIADALTIIEAWKRAR